METRTRTTTAKRGKVTAPVPVPAGKPGWVNPLENPDQSKSELDALISVASDVELPVMPVPADDLVNLPGGYITPDGVLIRTATVKELTGEDEEALAKASQSSNPFHFIDRLLKCGVVQLGDFTPALTEKALGSLLIGDREALILGIRASTYGNDITLAGWVCPYCTSKSDLTMEIEDIPVVDMNDPMSEINFEVPLRKGGHAQVHLATGEDQLAIFEKDGLTQVERETVLLSRCVEILTDSEGHRKSVSAFPSLVRSMSVPDRHAILDELAKRQPGPKYEQIEYSCENCGEGVKVAVGLGDLFLHFR